MDQTHPRTPLYRGSASRPKAKHVPPQGRLTRGGQEEVTTHPSNPCQASARMPSFGSRGACALALQRAPLLAAGTREPSRAHLPEGEREKVEHRCPLVSGWGHLFALPQWGWFNISASQCVARTRCARRTGTCRSVTLTRLRFLCTCGVSGSALIHTADLLGKAEESIGVEARPPLRLAGVAVS